MLSRIICSSLFKRFSEFPKLNSTQTHTLPPPLCVHVYSTHGDFKKTKRAHDGWCCRSFILASFMQGSSPAAAIFDAHKNLYVFALNGWAGSVAANVVCYVCACRLSRIPRPNEPEYYANEISRFMCHDSVFTARHRAYHSSTIYVRRALCMCLCAHLAQPRPRWMCL